MYGWQGSCFMVGLVIHGDLVIIRFLAIVFIWFDLAFWDYVLIVGVLAVYLYLYV